MYLRNFFLLLSLFLIIITLILFISIIFLFKKDRYNEIKVVINIIMIMSLISVIAFVIGRICY